jgi:hypothetical protein
MISMDPKAEDRLCRTVHISAPLVLALRRLGIRLTPRELRQLRRVGRETQLRLPGLVTPQRRHL